MVLPEPLDYLRLPCCIIFSPVSAKMITIRAKSPTMIIGPIVSRYLVVPSFRGHFQNHAVDIDNRHPRPLRDFRPVHGHSLPVVPVHGDPSCIVGSRNAFGHHGFTPLEGIDPAFPAGATLAV